MAADEWRSATSDMAIQQFDIAADKLGWILTWRAGCADRIGR